MCMLSSIEKKNKINQYKHGIVTCNNCKSLIFPISSFPGLPVYRITQRYFYNVLIFHDTSRLLRQGNYKKSLLGSE